MKVTFSLIAEQAVDGVITTAEEQSKEVTSRLSRFSQSMLEKGRELKRKTRSPSPRKRMEDEATKKARAGSSEAIPILRRQSSTSGAKSLRRTNKPTIMLAESALRAAAAPGLRFALPEDQNRDMRKAYPKTPYHVVFGNNHRQVVTNRVRSASDAPKRGPWVAAALKRRLTTTAARGDLDPIANDSRYKLSTAPFFSLLNSQIVELSSPTTDSHDTMKFLVEEPMPPVTSIDAVVAAPTSLQEQVRSPGKEAFERVDDIDRDILDDDPMTMKVCDAEKPSPVPSSGFAWNALAASVLAVATLYGTVDTTVQTAIPQVTRLLY